MWANRPLWLKWSIIVLNLLFGWKRPLTCSTLRTFESRLWFFEIQIRLDSLFLWSDLSKPVLQIIEHLSTWVSGNLEHDHVENGCKGRSSLKHVGFWRRIRLNLSPLTKIENIKIVKIILSFLFLTELISLGRFHQNSCNHKTVRLMISIKIILPGGQLRTSSPTKYVRTWKSETKNLRSGVTLQNRLMIRLELQTKIRHGKGLE